MNKILEERSELISELNTQIATLEKEKRERQSERTASYWWLIWLLLLIPIWWFLRKYKLI